MASKPGNKTRTKDRKNRKKTVVYTISENPLEFYLSEETDPRAANA